MSRKPSEAGRRANRKYKKNHPEKVKEIARVWYAAHRRRFSKWHTDYYAKVKYEVLSHYGKGGTLLCCWRGCGCIDPDMLTLDHVENDGAQQRRDGLYGGVRGYLQLRRRQYPSGYQTLCANHQFKKEMMRRRQDRV
jgi:hypothetical protein